MPDLSRLDPASLPSLTEEQLRELLAHAEGMLADDRKENQILFYQPVSASARQVHLSTAGMVGVGGGNGSSKTESCLAHLVALATGALPNLDPEIHATLRAQFRGPVNIRIVVESLTTTLYPIILPKLKWWVWTGVSEPGGEKGHWGWVPKSSLLQESWKESWSDKFRILTVLCRDPDNPERVLGESTFQFMSHDQDPTDFASGDFHHVMHDEPPRLAIWTENEARTMRVAGRMWLAMTWPDDPSIPVDWIYDQVYEPGSPGPNKKPGIDWFELDTQENRHLDQTAIEAQIAAWDAKTASVRIKGQPLRFSNRVHPLFTDRPATWCFTCNKTCLRAGDYCGCERQSTNIEDYCHVEDFEVEPNWPCVWLIDPHPRKPHFMMWVAVDPSDDVLVVDCAELPEDPVGVRRYCDELESALDLNVALRIMDPNMGRSPADARRQRNWEDEFSDAGLPCMLADDSDVGRGRVNDALKPDDMTRRPRILIHSRCEGVISQLKRFVWDDFRRSMERDQKQTPKDKYDDYPALLRYLMNWQPTFNMLYAGAPVLKRPGTRRGP